MKNSDEADLVVGSRYLQKNSLASWNICRKILTWIGHLLTKIFLKMPYDSTGAYRLYRLDKIPREFLNTIHSKGYSFF
ncbi:MAG: hypothetical protein AB1765_13420 [Candidatus Hydrogenedentota bacterium]